MIALTVLAGVLPAGVAGAEPPRKVPPGCVGGVAPNPSVEQVAANGQPAGYTFEPVVSVPPGTPDDQQPRLFTDRAQAVDGTLNALVSTPIGRVSTAYQAIPGAVPGGTYRLTVWAGTHDLADNQPVGLRFYDVNGRQVAERSVQVDHDIDTDGGLGRFDLPAVVAPKGTVLVRFFAATNANWIKWDCVYLTVEPPGS